MKILIHIFLMSLILIILAGFTPKHHQKVAFYVALTGSDSNPGTLEKPFATLEKARYAVQSFKKQRSLPLGGITVYIRGGIFSFSKTFTLTQEDSGAEKAPVTWRAYPGEEVIISGGKKINGFKHIDDPEILKRINAAYHDSILETDLKAQSIDDYGQITQNNGIGLELFFKGKRMTLARYPNEGWLNIADVPQTGTLVCEGSDTHVRLDIPLGKHYGRITYSGGRPRAWMKTDDIWLHGYWAWDWSDSYQKVKNINTGAYEFFLEEPHHSYGYVKGKRYYALNILEELDSPGEWYLDRKRGILYFWPPSPVNGDGVYVSMLDAEMISLDETSYITVQDIIFETARSHAISIKGGIQNRIAGCTIRNIGKVGITISGGKENGVMSCDIHEIGGGGIILSGGDRKTLTPAGNYAVNNHIHHYSRINRSNSQAITLSGVGNTISHNIIHHGPQIGIGFSGNDHLFEFNDVNHISQECTDVGAFGIARDWTMRGNILRYNYIHHLFRDASFDTPEFQDAIALHEAFEPMPFYQTYSIKGIYLNGNISGTTIYGNIFFKAGKAIMINGGRDNIVDNNIFVECDPSVVIGDYGLGFYIPEIAKHGSHRLYEKLEEADYKNPPYNKYPGLATILDERNPAIPKGNVIVNNVSFSYGGRWMDLWGGLDFSIVKVKNNLIADPEILQTRNLQGTRYVLYKYGEKDMMNTFEFNNNMVLNNNPGFIDIQNEDFRIKEDSPAWKLGFKPIPFEKIGLYIDEYRTKLPK